MGRFPRVTHPSAARTEMRARLACVKPAASVRSEPGSNSQVETSILASGHALSSANPNGINPQRPARIDRALTTATAQNPKAPEPQPNVMAQNVTDECVPRSIPKCTSNANQDKAKAQGSRYGTLPPTFLFLTYSIVKDQGNRAERAKPPAHSPR